MQRQSLGSPTSKNHQVHGVVKDNGAVTSLTAGTEAAAAAAASSSLDEDEYKPRKTAPLKPAEKYIHLIPLLTVVCFLILYLSSHDPSRIELAEFNGFTRLQKPTDSIDIDDMEQVLEIKEGDILAIRSLKNLQEMHKEGSSKYQLPRKIGDF